MIELLVGIESAEASEVREQIVQASRFAMGLHIDITDGEFVPVTTIGLDELQDIERLIPWEVHLMVTDPLPLMAKAVAVGCSSILVHPESLTDFDQFIMLSQTEHWPIGLSVSPTTHLTHWFDTLPSIIQHLTIMGVHPGRQGQTFLTDTPLRIGQAHYQYPHAIIGADGGIDKTTIQSVVSAGATRLVANSAIWEAVDPAMAYQELVQLAQTS